MVLYLRSDTARIPSSSPAANTDDAGMTALDPEQWYLCRGCLHPITRIKDECTVQGSHVHMFANPSGIVYEFRCFANAAGCALLGPESFEFTWFVGHRWRIAVCAGCRVHMGWKFTEGFSPGFFGLICDRLTLAATLRQ